MVSQHHLLFAWKLAGEGVSVVGSSEVAPGEELALWQSGPSGGVQKKPNAGGSYTIAVVIMATTTGNRHSLMPWALNCIPTLLH